MSASPSSTASAETAHVGQPFVNHGFKITVTKVMVGVKILPGSGDTGAGIAPTSAKNGQFVLVYLRVINISNSPQHYEDGTDSTLVDSNGRTFDECTCDYFGPTVNDDTGFRDTQQPEQTVTGMLAFDVPVSVTSISAVNIQPDALLGTDNKPTEVDVS